MPPFDVYVNVYDLTERNKFIYPFGLGVFHSGVEVNGVEYSFGGHDYDFTGIFKVQPKIGLVGIKFRESILMGQLEMSQEDLDNLMIDLGEKYIGRSYNLLTRNCNHFTAELVDILCQKQIPGWINRLAALGTWMPCFVDTTGEQFQPPTSSPVPQGHTTHAPFDLRGGAPHHPTTQCSCHNHEHS